MFMNIHSPLRYPGGKGKIAEYIKLIMNRNLLMDGQYVEPYAGGASVALSLLMNEFVSEIHINDIDKSIYAFWYSVLNETDALCEKIRDTPVTLEERNKQKEIQKTSTKHSLVELGFSLFFLNRTNRSGIIKAGVIGGNKQNGKWKIDARFNKRDLISRIKKIARYKNRINLYNMDAIELIKELVGKLPKKTLFYLDPPYYNKGKQLYVNYYTPEDHREISKVVGKLKNNYWIVSYDNVSEIKSLYKNFRQIVYELSYSVGKASIGQEVMIFSNNLSIPIISKPTIKGEVKNFYAQQGFLQESYSAALHIDK